MKRFLALFLALILCFSLVACGENTTESVESSSPQNSKPQSAKPENEEVKNIVMPEVMNATKYSCTVASYDGLILRLGPGTSYDAVAVIDHGTELTELANQNGWVFVEASGQKGWVFGQYLTYKD